MSLKHQAVRSAIWRTLQVCGSELLAALTFIAMVRLLDADDFGLLALTMLFIEFAQIFQRQGLGSAIVQVPSLDRRHIDTAFWMCLVSGLCLALLSLAAAGPVSVVFDEPRIEPLIRVLSPLFILGAFETMPIAVLRRRMAFKFLATRRIAANAAAAAVGIAMAWSGYGVYSLVGYTLTMNVVGVAVLLTAGNFLPRTLPSRPHLKQLLSFGAPVIGIDAVTFLERRMDILLIGPVFGATLLGYYAAARRLLQLLTRLFTQSIDAVAFPTFSRVQHDVARMRSALTQTTQAASMLAFPAFFGVAALAPQIVNALFGSDWSASIPVLQTLAFLGILQPISYFQRSAVMAAGKPLWAFGFVLLSTAFLATTISCAITASGSIVTVAVVTVITAFVLEPIQLAMIKRLIRLQPTEMLRGLRAPLFAATVMGLAVFGSTFAFPDLQPQLALAARVILGVAIYGLILWLVARERVLGTLQLLRNAIRPDPTHVDRPSAPIK